MKQKSTCKRVKGHLGKTPLLSGEGVQAPKLEPYRTLELERWDGELLPFSQLPRFTLAFAQGSASSMGGPSFSHEKVCI